MKARTALIAIALAVPTLFAAPALADCNHGSTVATWSTPVPAGRYETRVENRWVEGRYVQQWIEGRCVERGRHHRRVRCESGRYAQVWVPGHYESVSRQVWVAYGGDDYRGERDGYREYRYR